MTNVGNGKWGYRDISDTAQVSLLVNWLARSVVIVYCLKHVSKTTHYLNWISTIFFLQISFLQCICSYSGSLYSIVCGNLLWAENKWFTCHNNTLAFGFVVVLEHFWVAFFLIDMLSVGSCRVDQFPIVDVLTTKHR